MTTLTNNSLDTGSEPFLQLHSGIKYYFLNPTPEMISIDDIAHTLSLLCRYGGHCREFYSVAEHSVRCSYKAPKGFEFEALMHDAGEAYLIDMPRPIKQKLPDYQNLERVTEKVITTKFNLPWPMSPEVKVVDNRMLFTEKRDILSVSVDWGWECEPYENKIIPWTPRAAKEAFMERFNELVAKKPKKVIPLKTNGRKKKVA